MLVLVPLISACAEEDRSFSGGEESLCASFGTEAGADLIKAEAFESCPVYVNPIEGRAGAHKIPVEKRKQLAKRQREAARQDVRLFRRAERDGYLDRPAVQKRIMEVVARDYLAEQSLDYEITEEIERAYYREHIDEFGYPETRLGRHILIQVPEPVGQNGEKEYRARIDELYEQTGGQIDKMEFAMLANKNSDDKQTALKGGLMEPTARSGEKREISPVMAEVLFSLEKRGEVSKPVRTKQGWHIVQLAGVLEGQTRKFEEVRELVRVRLKHQKKAEAIDKLLSEESS